MTQTLALQTTQLTRQFDELVAVDHLDLKVARGCFYGFLGPNGAGKSTTIKMLTGLLAPTGGQVAILGLDITDPAQSIQLKSRMGVVPENLALYDNLTGREYLTFIGRMYGLEREVIRQRTQELLEVMQLQDQEKKLTMEFSHGMQKKLALAAALIADPDLLFLDEPFEGVDAVSSRILRQVLQRSVDRGATVFLTSHVLEIVEKLCTHVGIIAQGRLVHEGTMEELQQGRSLEDRFLEVVGKQEQIETSRLSWLDNQDMKSGISD